VSPDRDHDQVQELLGAYALDAVEELDRRDIEAHLATCPPCRAEVVEHLETAAMLAAATERAPDGVWDEISDRLDERPPVIDLEAAAVALGVAAVTEQQQRIEQLAAEADEARLARAAAAAAVRDDARFLTLASESGDVRVEVVILPDGRGYLVEDDLRPLPPGRTTSCGPWADRTRSRPACSGVTPGWWPSRSIRPPPDWPSRRNRTAGS
jgi:Putative zinc-finger